MKNRLLYLMKYGLYWLAFFMLSRSLFLLYNHPLSGQLPLNDLLHLPFYGLKLDVSLAGYIVFFSSLLLFFMALNQADLNRRVMRIFTFILLLVFSAITVVDMELYRNWGYRMDSSVLLYVQTPKESLASTPIGLSLLLLGCIILLCLGALWGYVRWVEKSLWGIKALKWFYAPIFLLLAAVMIIPIRGGIGIAPINQGSVFFSKHAYANHAALNELWNFGESLSTMNQHQEIAFMDPKAAAAAFQELLSGNRQGEQSDFIAAEKPNIIIIILESFTAKVVEPLGEKPG